MLQQIDDPKGYYAALGVPPSADEGAIKAAYRSRAKALHPDINPARDAGESFQRVVEAYRVLRDPLRRLIYQAGGGEAVTPLHPLIACQCCGRTTAQPRFVVFHRVRSALLLARRQELSGIFCRACADRTALRASLDTWLGGWWSLPGLLLAPLALLRNLSGGTMPARRNLDVLLDQARAFLARGERDVAAALVIQARRFARSDEDRERCDAMSAVLGQPARRLRDRWRPWGAAFLLQLLPVLALAAAAGAAGARLWGTNVAG